MQTSLFAVLAALTFSPTFAQTDAGSAVAPSEEVTLEMRLEKLVERMKKERVDLRIPGFALAVVVDGEVVLSRGFGLADIEANRPVTPETIFAIGSSTKAFTATLIGMLQDDDSLSIDDPVTEYLPYFELPIESAEGSEVTLRDLLCHRTGFTRMSALWATGDTSRDLILRTAVNAEPWAGFREEFLYNNVMFLAAGEASAAAADMSWDELLEKRIFEPLGMDSSTSSTRAAQKDERLALGYEWNEDTEEFEHKQMIELSGIAPAGAINSNVIDMAKWVRFQLAEGEFEGEQLISKRTLVDTWTPNIEMGENVGYGLGWMIHSEKGERIIEHGGNIDGFGAQVAFMPTVGVGYVLLTNVSATPLQNKSMSIVFDALLEDLSEEAVSTAEYEKFVGLYDANFGPFKDEKFEVLIQNGNLSVDVPGQTVYELHPPDEDGKRYFRLTDTIAVSFDLDGNGLPTLMKMYQSGLTFEMPREGAESEIEIPLEEFNTLLGKFFDPALKTDFEVVVSNNRLAIDIPGQMVFELHVPDEDGKRHFRVSDELAVRFNQDEDGAVNSMTMYERGTVRELARTGEAPESDLPALPTLAELTVLHQPRGYARILAEHGTLRASGKIKMLQSGIEGSYVLEVRQAPSAYRIRTDLGPFGKSESGSDGKIAWSYDSAHGYNELSGDRLRQTLRDHPSIIEGDWRESFKSASVQKRIEKNDRQLLVVETQWGDLPMRTIHVEEETGLIVGVEFLYLSKFMSLPVAVEYSDFRELEGVVLFHQVVEENSAVGRTIHILNELKAGVDLAEDFHEYEAD